MVLLVFPDLCPHLGNCPKRLAGSSGLRLKVELKSAMKSHMRFNAKGPAVISRPRSGSSDPMVHLAIRSK